VAPTNHVTPNNHSLTVVAPINHVTPIRAATIRERFFNHQAAIIHYRRAAARTINLPQRNYLPTRAARIVIQLA